MKKTDVIIINPPSMQLNSLYPASSFLSGYVKMQGYSAVICDLNLKYFLNVFNNENIEKIFIQSENKISSSFAEKIYSLKESYIDSVDYAVAFLQKSSISSAKRIARQEILPEPSDQAVHNLSLIDPCDAVTRARIMCTYFLAEISKYISETIDSSFGLIKYAEKISSFAPDFKIIENEVLRENILTDIYYSVLDSEIGKCNPLVFAVTIPFPGTLVWALRAHNYIRKKYPNIIRCSGGGFVNTELRSITDKKFFEYVNYLTMDDGEIPLLRIVKKASGEGVDLVRTFSLDNGTIVYNNAISDEPSCSDLPVPDYTGINTDEYLKMADNTNPMLSMWNSDFYLKMNLAHGCYWKKCEFCDTSLDYIKRYDPATAVSVVEKIKALSDKTKINSFHFTDEAAPPNMLRDIAIELIARKINITWWTNVRFEKKFTKDISRLLYISGCLGLSGGLEAADERVLRIMNKGVTLHEALSACADISSSGIMVHAYLIYGFPTQTEQEISNSLETVRCMFEKGFIISAFYHRYAMTIHSESGMNPGKYGLIARTRNNSFANNEIMYTGDSVDYSKYSSGLSKAVGSYNEGQSIEREIECYFDFPICKPVVGNNIFEDIKKNQCIFPDDGKYLLWNLCGTFSFNSRKGHSLMSIVDKSGSDCVNVDNQNINIIKYLSENASLYQGKKILIKDIENNDSFGRLKKSSEWKYFRENGLILIV